MKRYCRTYTINDESLELYAFTNAKNEEEAEDNLYWDYPNKEDREIHWTSSVFEVKP